MRRKIHPILHVHIRVFMTDKTIKRHLRAVQIFARWIVRVDIPLVEVDIGLLADQVGVAATDTLDLGQGVHDLLLTLNIGVEETQNVLEVRLLAGHERYRTGDDMLAYDL